MTAGPLLSVRGSARRTLPPDLGVLHGLIECHAPSKAEALERAGAAQQDVVDALTALGGVPGSADGQVALAWLSRQVSTSPEQEYDSKKNRHVRTGRTIARVSIEVRVRDLGRVGPVTDALEAVEHFAQQYAQWLVDDDNPGWRAVRADAIHNALRQADDYAAALRCRVARVEQVADAGLLSAGPVDAAAPRGAVMAAGAMGGGPDLDPVPQLIAATIDVRCSTEQLTP